MDYDKVTALFILESRNSDKTLDAMTYEQLQSALDHIIREELTENVHHSDRSHA